MTISSVGYNGAITSTVWPAVAVGLGQRYFVPGPDQVVCTALQGGTRQVQIGTGSLGGQGVFDTISAAETVTLPTVSSQTAWSMIVARRTWQSTNATTLVAIPAGTTANAATPPTTLPARNTTPGTLDDQPLWLVPLTVNDTVPGTPIDLRVLGSAGGARYIRNVLALQYLQVLGAEIRLGSTTYRCQLNATGTGVEWSASGVGTRRAALKVSGSNLINYGPSWGFTSGGVHDGYLNENEVQLYLQPRRYDSDLTFDSNGGLFDNLIGNLVDNRFFPMSNEPLQMTMFGGTTSSSFFSYTAYGELQPSGALYLTAGPPSIILPRRTTVDVSLRISVHFMRGDAS